MLAIIFGGFGLIIGSFLNVLILRHGFKSAGGRSACPHCHHALAWYDMFPVLSWIALRGKCRYCRGRISIQYPLVEAATAAVFMLIAVAPFPVDIFYRTLFCAIAALLIAIFVYDLYHTIIPDAWAYLFDGLAFFTMGPLYLALGPEAPLWLYVLAGPFAALPLFLLWFISKGEWMGFGDVKLALGIGWLLGATLGVFSVFFAFVIGAVFFMPLLILSSDWWRSMVGGFTPTPNSSSLVWGFTMKSEIPFGPFLITSCLLLWFALLYNVPVPVFFADIYGL